jgi:uncharacterized protein (UPF0332 family)
MSAEAQAQWDRAVRSLRAAALLVDGDPDSAASRAYYAAFHAASALFALKGRTFTKHSAVQAAVYRELVHAGVWETALGKDYSFLVELRFTGDYGGTRRVGSDEARDAVRRARRILDAVRTGAPDIFAEMPDSGK